MSEIVNLSIDEQQNAIKEGVAYVDVRTASERAEGYVEGSKFFIPLHNEENGSKKTPTTWKYQNTKISRGS